MNACRGWRWAETGIWGSKLEGEKRDLGHDIRVKRIVEDAVEARFDGNGLEGRRVLDFLELVKTEMFRN